MRETCAAVLRFRTCFLWGVGAGIVLGVPLLISLGFYVGSLTSPYVFYGFVAGLIVGLPLSVRIFLRMMGDINARAPPCGTWRSELRSITGVRIKAAAR